MILQIGNPPTKIQHCIALNTMYVWSMQGKWPCSEGEEALFWSVQLYSIGLWLADKISCLVCPITIQLNRPKEHLHAVRQFTLRRSNMVLRGNLCVSVYQPRGVQLQSVIWSKLKVSWMLRISLWLGLFGQMMTIKWSKKNITHSHCTVCLCYHHKLFKSWLILKCDMSLESSAQALLISTQNK